MSLRLRTEAVVACCFDMRSPRPKEHLKRQDVWPSLQIASGIVGAVTLLFIAYYIVAFCLGIIGGLLAIIGALINALDQPVR